MQTFYACFIVGPFRVCVCASTHIKKMMSVATTIIRGCRRPYGGGLISTQLRCFANAPINYDDVYARTKEKFECKCWYKMRPFWQNCMNWGGDA